MYIEAYVTSINSIKFPSGSWIKPTITPGRIDIPGLITVMLFLLQILIISSRLLKFIVIYLIPFEVEKSPIGFLFNGLLSRTYNFIKPTP